MKKFLLLVSLALLLGFSGSVSAVCSIPPVAVTFSYNYCQNVTVYNNDTANRIDVNSTVALVNLDVGALIAAGKVSAGGGNLILAYGKQEIARFNTTGIGSSSQTFYLNVQTQINPSSSNSNYWLAYGASSETLANRKNETLVANYLLENFNTLNSLNATGYWANAGAGYAITSNGTTGYLTIGNGNGTNWNVYGINRGLLPAPANNASVIFRIKNETNYGASQFQYVSGTCQSTNLVSCGAVNEYMFGFLANATPSINLAWGSNAGATTLANSNQNFYWILEIHHEPTGNQKQFWRSTSSTATRFTSNSGNSSALGALATWNPAFGVDGGAQSINVSLDWVMVRKLTTINEPTVIISGAEDTAPAVSVSIWNPTNITYYNATSYNVSFSLNATSNSSSMQTYRIVNGVTTFTGYTANGTVNTSFVSGFLNGQNNLTITGFDTTNSVNGTASVYFTQVNGLNVTVFNASQGVSTALSVSSINVTNATNSSTSYNSSSSPIVLDTRTIPNGGGNSFVNMSVDLIVNKSGYVTSTYTGNVTSANGTLFNVYVPLWRLQEFHFLSSNGTNATTWSLTVYSGTNITTYSTTNGTIQISLGSIPTGSFIGQAAATGMNTTNTTFSANSTSEINYTITGLQAGIFIFAYDEASCALSCQRIYFGYTATNGTNTTTNYSVIGTFLNETYNAFPQGSVTFTFNNSVNGTYFPRSYILTISSSTSQILNVYLLNNTVSTVAATYCTQNAGGVAISGASLTVQRLIGSSYVTVAQGTTGSDGCFTFYLDSLTTYQIIASATGYNTGTFTVQPKAGTSYITLTNNIAVKGFQTSYSDDDDLVLTRLLPEDSSVNFDWVLVNFTVYSLNSTLTNWGMYCLYNGTAIYNVNVTTSPSGGTTTSNITLTNKTSPLNFYCYGLFDRTGYNTTFVNRTFYIGIVNQTYNATNLQNGLSNAGNGTFSQQTLVGASILLALVGTAGIAPYVPVGSGIIFMGFINAFGMIGWINSLLLLLFDLIAVAYAFFNSRQF